MSQGSSSHSELIPILEVSAAIKFFLAKASHDLVYSHILLWPTGIKNIPIPSQDWQTPGKGKPCLTRGAVIKVEISTEYIKSHQLLWIGCTGGGGRFSEFRQPILKHIQLLTSNSCVSCGKQTTNQGLRPPVRMLLSQTWVAELLADILRKRLQDKKWCGQKGTHSAGPVRSSIRTHFLVIWSVSFWNQALLKGREDKVPVLLTTPKTMIFLVIGESDALCL